MTDHQRAILELAAEHHAIAAFHARLLMRSTDQEAEHELDQLTRAGLIRHHRAHHAQAGHYQITTRGLAAINSPLPEPRFDTIADHRTILAAAALTIAARRGRFPDVEHAVPERVQRHHDATHRQHGPQPTDDDRAEDPLYGIAMATGIDTEVPRHYPPLMLLLTTGWRIAFEIQIHQPPPVRLAAQITAYASDPDVQLAIYLINQQPVAETIMSVADQLGLRDAMRVQRITVTTDPTIAQ